MPPMPLCFLASADLHLGRSSSYLNNDQQASTRSVWQQMVQFAIDEEVDAVLLAGDIIDEANAFFEATEALKQGIARLAKNGIHTVMVCGNHDAVALPPSVSALPEAYQPFVHLLGMNGKWEYQTIDFKGRKAAFLGWSFPRAHVYENPTKGVEISLPEGLPVIGLLHGDAFDANSPYAPFGVADLSPLKADFWLLGHIHKREKLQEYPSEVWYPGSPQAMSPKESGAHGPLLIEAGSKTNIRAEALDFSFVRYETISFTLDETLGIESLSAELVRFLDRESAALRSKSKSKVFVFDLICRGRYPDHGAVKEAMQKLLDQDNHDGLGHFRIRKVYFEMEAVVTDLGRIAGSELPEAVFAEALIALEHGQAHPFLSELESEWTKRFDDLSNNAAFKLLQNEKDRLNAQKARMQQYIKATLHRLLSEVDGQREKTQKTG